MKGAPTIHGTILYHAVFSTVEQRPLITPEIEPLLYDKISKILFDECFSPPLMIGGDVEHVHILYVGARNWSADSVIDRVRVASAEFIRKWSPDFAWQKTYAVVTMSRSQDEIDKDYIARQKEIHKTLSYKDEFRHFLEENFIEYDENDLWD